MKKIKKKTIIWLIIAFIIYGVLMYLTSTGKMSRQYTRLLIPIGINIMLAVSLNLTVGFLGELTLGHAGFMSVGAYAGCMFTVYMDLPVYIEFPLAILVGGAVAAIFGIIIGIPALRLKGDYLAIVTLAFGEIIKSVITNMNITGGAGGLKGIEKTTNFTMVFAAVLITIIVISNLINSRHGRAICAIRDNVIAAEAAGINVVYYKLIAFVVAAFFAGVAGVLYGHNLGILKPATFDFNKSIEILVIVVLGSMGSITGSVIAAIVITALPELLRGLADYRMLMYAIVLIVMMLLNANPRVVELKKKYSAKVAELMGKLKKTKEAE